MIYIGDKVRIKTWDEMEAEFGLEEIKVGEQKESVIDCEGYFTESMKVLCGKEFIITDTITDSNFKFINTTTNFPIDRLYGLEEADEQDLYITEDMIESL